MMHRLLHSLAELFIGFVAISASLIGVASVVARQTDDAAERKDATVMAFWSLIVFALCAAAILSLSGCSRNEIQYLGCLARDNTSRPCN
jgi:hypothetical protein